MSELVLSLFPGIGLLDMAFEEQGYSVVRGPDALWGGDIKRFHVPPGRFDGVIGGPPCKAFSRLRHMVAANGYELAENLIPEFERVVSEAQPVWFLMENVPDAPIASVPGYKVHALHLDNRWFGAIQSRARRFCFGTRDGRPLKVRPVALMDPTWASAVTSHARATPVAMLANGKRKKAAGAAARTVAEACELQGLPRDFLDEAPFTNAGKHLVIGNGVPRPLGDAVALAVKEAMQ